MFSMDLPTPHDVEALVAVGRKTYEDTFIGVAYYTKELVEGYTTKAFTIESIQRELLDPAVHYRLLRVNGAVAGYLKLVESAPPSIVGDEKALYLQRIYLLDAFQGQGLGRALLHEAYRIARARSYPKLWLSVWTENLNAIEFYKKQGWHIVGQWDWKFTSCGQSYIDRDHVMTIEPGRSERC